MSSPLGARRERSPWPYHFTIAGTGVLGGTVNRRTTSYTSYKPADQANVVPSDFGYAADNPDFGAITAYSGFPMGMGLKSQRRPNAADDHQYDHAIGVDASVWPWVKGPDITAFAPTTTDAANGVVRFMKVGASYYAITGRYALLRVSDASWTVAQDFGAGKVALDALAFYSNGVGAAYGFVAMGDADNLWTVTGGVWTQHASLRALAFGLVGREFWRAHSVNTLAKVDTDADPTVAGNWGNANAFTIGDKSSPITRLVTTPGDVLLAVKTAGVWTLDEVGDDHRLQEAVPYAGNGRAAARWGNELYLGLGYGGTWRYDATGGSRQQMGPELLTDGSNVVAGIVTACCGAEGPASALWAAVTNPDSSWSYLCKFVGLLDAEGPGGASGQPHPVWHGSLSQPLASMITAMDVQTDGAPAGHARVYLGFRDGTLGWFTLACTRHPADCSSYRFGVPNGTVRLPTWGGGFGADVKALDAVTVTGRNLAPATHVLVSTRRADGIDTFAPMPEPFDAGQRERVAFPPGAAATMLELQATLVNALNTASPQVFGLGLHHQLQTPYRQVFEIRVLCEDGLRRRDGTPMRLGRDATQAALLQAADTPGSVVVVFPEGTARRCRIRGLQKDVAFDHATRRTRAAYVLSMTEVSTQVISGTYDRLEAIGAYEILEQYTYDQLENL